MLKFTKKLSETRFRQDIAQRVDTDFIQLFQRSQGIADLIGGIAEQERDLFCSPGYTLQNERKTVAAEYRENKTDLSAGKVALDIIGYVINTDIVAFRSSNNRFSNSDDITIMQIEFLGFRRTYYTVDHNFT